MAIEARNKAKAAFANLPTEKQAEHNANFTIIERGIQSLLPKGAKVFEAHHAIEHARSKYLSEMVHNSHSPWHCKRAVVAMYPGHEAAFN